MFRLLFRNLLFRWRSNLAVLLGVVIGTAVLTGALLVGDSLRGSLRDLTLKRLGRIDHALVSDRFFRAALAKELMQRSDVAETTNLVSPAILLQGSVIRYQPEAKLPQRAGRVQVVGVDESFWSLFHQNTPGDLSTGVVVNQPLAEALGLQKGDEVEIRLEKPQAVPADSLLGRRDETSALTIERSPVVAVLPEDGAGRFSLQVQQQRPMTAFVDLRRLQIRLRESTQQPNPANTLLIAAKPDKKTDADAERLQQALRQAVTLDDLGLVLRPDQTGERCLSLESRRMLLEPAVVEAVRELARKEGLQLQPTLTYLANVMTSNHRLALQLADAIAAGMTQPAPVAARSLVSAAGSYVPYSTVTGLDPGAPAPWGPLIDLDGKPWMRPLGPDEILLNEWAARDLWPRGDWRPGEDTVMLRYFVESDGWLLKEVEHTFKLAGVVALRGPAADPTLTPDFPGVRGRSVRDWKPPFPKEQWHPEWVRPRDDLYWRGDPDEGIPEHRATPKAFIAPETAQRLWKSRYGEYTSLRIAPKPGPRGAGLGSAEELATLAKTFPERLREYLPAEKLGLEIQPVKELGLQAASSSTSQSFGWLFLGFSSFLIVSAAMLVGLLFRLGIERRAKEVGLLHAAGFRPATVRRMLLGEAALIASLGGLVGLALAVGYAWLLIHGLRRAWSDTLQTSFLRFDLADFRQSLGPLPYASLILGFTISLLIAVVTIWWALRALKRIPPRALLAGQGVGEDEVPHRSSTESTNRRKWFVATALVLAPALGAASFFVSRDVAPPLFFGSGAALLAAGLGLVALWMRRDQPEPVTGHGMPALARLGARNTGRNVGRSLLTAGLLACATFLIVAVESFRKSETGEAAGKDSGTGGFPLLAETDVPLRQAPNTPELQQALFADLDPKALASLTSKLAEVRFFGFRVRPGDDVSCLNLYQPQQPRILGVPQDLLDRGGFAFAALDHPTEDERRNPWLLLKRSYPGETPAVPVLMDEHTATWVLQKRPGDTWTIPNELGQTIQLRLAGLLKGSIFQSELLISEDQFRAHFPSRGGYSFFLVEAPAANTKEVKPVLDAAGFHVTAASDRLAAYHAVENTYLSTFQVLGGLGLLLGTLGLAVVLLRNVWERRGELALMRALGYSRAALGWLVLAENGFLILLGLAVGIVAALLAVTPHLLERAASIPWLGVLALLGLVLLFGLFTGALAVASTLRTPLLPALRRE